MYKAYRRGGFIKFVLAAVLPMLNLLLFGFWLLIESSLFETPLCCGAPSNIEVIQLQLVMLEVTVVFVSIVMVFFGYFGYQLIKSSAVDAATKIAEERFPILLNEGYANFDEGYVNFDAEHFSKD